MYKKSSKIMASLVVFIMLLANVGPIGAQIGQVIAADGLNNQTSKTNYANVEFDSYFVEGNNKTHETQKNIGEDNKIVAQISVKDAGYLNDATVKFVDSNFKVLNQIDSENVSAVEDNTLAINQINAGENAIVEIPFTFAHDEKVNLEQFDKVSSVMFTAKYVDGKGKTHNIKKEIKLGLKWTANAEIELNTEVAKYVSYDVENNKGVLLQTVVKEAIKDNMLPEKTSNIEIKVPDINGVYPVNATVEAQENMEYTFDAKNNKLTITTKNDANEQNEIIWSNSYEKEFVISYVYPKTAITEEAVQVNLDAVAKLQVYSYDNKELNAEYKNTITLQDKIGEIVDIAVTSTERLGKGIINANFDREDKLETLYSKQATLSISLPELVSGMTVNMNSDNFTKGDKVLEGNSYYKNLRISKKQFIEYFGEEGSIDIYSGETLIQTINKDIKDEVIVVELNADNIIINTSKPIKEGKFTFDFDKAIKKDEVYTLNQVKELDGILEETNLVVKNNDLTIVDKTVSNKVELANTELKAGLHISNVNLSTVVPNQDIELRAVLNTNTLYNKLFKNPVIAMTLPSYIEKINIKNVQVLFDEELTVKNYRVEGSQIIVELDGIQTNYNIGSSYEGTNIVITADLETNNLTPNKTESMTMTITSNDEQIEAKLDLNFVAPSGVVAINKISNYVEGQELMALTDDESAILEVQTSAKNATEEIQIINNYNNNIEKVEILGRTLTTDTTATNNSVKLNNNLNAPMTGAINTGSEENAQVYYSNNGNATRDLNNEQNGWTTTPEDLSQVKSYLIVLDENQKLNSGDSVNFSYDMQIPENLNYSMASSSLYTVYFDNVQEDQTINDQVTSRMLTLGTGIAPDLNVTLSSNIEENSTVYSGQYIKYTATIKNNSNVDAENVVLNVSVPTTGNDEIFEFKHVEYKEENFFVGYEESEDAEKSISVGKIEAGKQASVDFEIKVDQIDISSLIEANVSEEEIYNRIETAADSSILTMKARVIADRMQREVESNEYKLNVQKGELEVLVSRDATTDTVLIKDDELTYTANVRNLTADNIENVVVKVKIPSGLSIESANVEDLVDSDDTQEGSYDIDNRNNIVTFTFNSLLSARSVNCNVKTKVGDALGFISSNVEVTANNKKYIGNVLNNEVSKLDFTITQSRLDSAYVKEQETITFEYVVTNNSKVYTNDFTLENIIPDGMEIVSVQTVIGDESMDVRADEQDGKVIVNRTFKGEQTIIFRITMRAKLLPDGTTQKQITNYASIYGRGFETKESNKVNATIEYNERAYRGYEPTPEDPDNPVTPTGKKVISGLAFIDKNQDGERNDTEELVTGMEVRLLNAQTNEVIKTTNTSSTGEYVFTELENGEYLVVFVYDITKYDLSVYRKAGVSQSTNSDAIDIDMEIDGVNRKVGITDTIRLTDSNQRNIDIGLVESNKTDLKLDKYITSITVSYGNTVKTYDYEDAKLAKIEIPAKELSNATIIVNYKFVVTNEGAISNYVKKIVDYVPSEMKFNSELNRDWYQSTSGDIYNSSLANIKLEPGQSKELSLTLTKKMTSENTGLINNNAELYEVYNEESIADYDSTPANKVSGEDDMSAADVVVGVKTGDAVIYTILISTLICIVIGVSAYYIRKSILKRV